MARPKSDDKLTLGYIRRTLFPSLDDSHWDEVLWGMTQFPCAEKEDVLEQLETVAGLLLAGVTFPELDELFMS